jgi:hypothetical protein
VAGRGGRKSPVELISYLATALGKNAPGIKLLEFKIKLAGRRGRKPALEFINGVATAFSIDILMMVFHL